MFSFFKRKARTEPTPAVSPVGLWKLSEEDELLDQMGVYTYDKLDTLKVDLKRRKFICKDGKALSIDQLARRLHKSKPHMPIEDIEDSVMSWLVEAYEPEGITDGDKEEEAQLKIEAWLEAHEEILQTSEIG